MKTVEELFNIHIPDSWDSCRLKFLNNGNLKYGANESAEDENPDHPRYIRITDFNDNGTLRDDTYKSLPPNIAEDYLLDDGDVLFARSGATVGKTFIYQDSGKPSCFAGYLIKVSPSPDKLISRFLYHFTRSNTYQNWKDSIFIQATIQNIGADKYSNLVIPLPDLETQKQIADFLDKETIRIDTLITKKQKQIELLNEKRQDIITQSVTKGLNENVKMKDSGVEWIGEIPEHWEVKRLRHVGNAIIGLTYSPNDVTDESEGTLVLRSSNIHNGKIVLEDNVYVNTKIPEKLRTIEGDILICSRNGSEKLVGKSGMITSNEKGLSFGAFTTIFRSNVNNYLFYFFNSGMMKEQSGLFNTSTVFQLTTGILNNFRVAIPPDEEERDRIVNFLNIEINNNESLILKIRNSIDLLKEYRSSLITHTISGQIDISKYEVSK